MAVIITLSAKRKTVILNLYSVNRLVSILFFDDYNGDLSNLRLILGLSESLCQVFKFYCIFVEENDH